MAFGADSPLSDQSHFPEVPIQQEQPLLSDFYMKNPYWSYVLVTIEFRRNSAATGIGNVLLKDGWTITVTAALPFPRDRSPPIGAWIRRAVQKPPPMRAQIHSCFPIRPSPRRQRQKLSVLSL